MALFAPAYSRHKVRIEASVWYFFSQTAAEDILQMNSDAKFVVCLRNPIDMAPSLHAQALANKSAAYENTVSFAKAWGFSDQRFEGRRIGLAGPKFGARVLAYRQACLLGTQLTALLGVVPVEQVHVVLVDDLKNNARNEWLEFLGLSDDGRLEFPVANAATAPKSFRLHRILNWAGWLKRALGINKRFNLLAGVYRKNLVKKQYKAPEADLHEELRIAFEPEIQILERLLDRDLSGWRQR